MKPPLDLRRIDKFFEQATDAVSPAVILGGGVHGLAFVRSLGRKGIPVLSIGGRAHPAMLSRYGIPYIEAQDNGHDAALLDLLLAARNRLPATAVIIPCSDYYASFLSRQRNRLAPYYEFVIPNEATFERLASKSSQYQLARDAGIAIPETVGLTGDLESLSASIGYPCVVKPAHSHLWADYQARAKLPQTKLLVANSARELIDQGSIIRDSGLEWVAQELVEGPEDELYALYAYFDRDSRPLAVFVRRKLRQWPVAYGNGCYSIGVCNTEVVDLGIQFCQSIGYRGLTNIEFKRDATSGNFKLIEINVRSAAQASLAIDSGVDLPYIAYRDALREPVERVFNYVSGRRWVNLTADTRSFLERHRRRELGLGSWLASLVTVRSHAYWAWDDPMPALAIWSRLIRGKVGKLFKRRNGPPSKAPNPPNNPGR